MHLFTNPRAKRGTLFVMVLVWVLALVAGVANACLLEGPGQHSQNTEDEHFSVTRDVSEMPLRHLAVGASHHEAESGSSNAPCLRVCDDRAQTLLKHPSGIALTDCGQAPFVAIAWSAAGQLTSTSVPTGDVSLAAAGPPIRVRLSRLAL